MLGLKGLIEDIAKEVFIGIDLAWGEKNLSGLSVIAISKNKLKIIDTKLIKTIEEIVNEITKYNSYKVYVGVDAPLIVPNQNGNREIEKSFNKDFSKYKISMLPTNRELLLKNSDSIRSEILFNLLTGLGFKRDFKFNKVIFEVYPHSTIATLFNDYKILPYKRKKGRNVEFIKNQLLIYQNYLSSVFSAHDILKVDVLKLKGQKIKDYEDRLDSLTCAYTMFYCKYNDTKTYKLDNIDTFITPSSLWKVYILKCSDNTYYTGITTDLTRRVYEHNNLKSGAKYTKARRPVKLVYYENLETRISASKREYEIKQLSKEGKKELFS
jgi:putative endonuclease